MTREPFLFYTAAAALYLAIASATGLLLSALNVARFAASGGCDGFRLFC